MKHFWLALLLCAPAFAAYENPQEAFELTPEELDPTAEEIRFSHKEKHSFDESYIFITNTELGVQDQRRFTGLDRNKLSLSIHVNGQYEYLQRLNALDLTWLRRTDNWTKLWWGATLRQTNTRLDQITTLKTQGPEAALPKDSDQTITTLGLGAGYRFKLLLDFLKTENVFETIQAFATYNTLQESTSGESYTGYGLTADYGLHKRTRTSFFYGAKFSYNISYVALDRDREFSLGWYTFALETGFIF